MSNKHNDPPAIRTSSRKRVPSLRVLEAEAGEEVRREPTRPLKKPKVAKVASKKAQKPKSPKVPKLKAPKKDPKPKKPRKEKVKKAVEPEEKKAVKNAEKEGDGDEPIVPQTSVKKPIRQKITSMPPYILVILVHVDRQGNSTEFWTAPKAKITPAQLEKLAACHHGALNDDEDQFRDIFALLVRHFTQLDEIFFEKPNIKPVKIDQFISEVYQMHFGDFGNTTTSSSSFENQSFNNF